RVYARADVDHAHAAYADRVIAVVVAEDRNLDPGALRGVVDRGALGHRELLTVDAQRDGLGCRRSGDRHVLQPSAGYRACTNRSKPSSVFVSGSGTPCSVRPRPS